MKVREGLRPFPRHVRPGPGGLLRKRARQVGCSCDTVAYVNPNQVVVRKEDYERLQRVERAFCRLARLVYEGVPHEKLRGDDLVTAGIMAHNRAEAPRVLEAIKKILSSGKPFTLGGAGPKKTATVLDKARRVLEAGKHDETRPLALSIGFDPDLL